MSEHLYLIAHIAGHPLALRSDQIESVVDLGPVTAVPRAGGHVRGLAALRSRVVTVVDTRAALGLAPAATPGSRAVIVAHGGHHYALLVDTLDDVAGFAASAIDTGLSLSPRWAAAARGLIERDGETLLILDPTALIPGANDPGEAMRAAHH